MSLKGARERICSNYDSGAATVSDGQNDEDPSHGSQSENDRAAGYLASQSHAIISAMSMTTTLQMKWPAQRLMIIDSKR